MRERRCETVMLVNDDGASAGGAWEALRTEGYAVLLVPGVPQAVGAVLAGFRPDAVVLQLSARADVSELREVLWGTPGLRDVPVLLAAQDGRGPGRLVR